MPEGNKMTTAYIHQSDTGLVHGGIEWGFCPDCEQIVWRQVGYEYWRHAGYINECCELIPMGLNVDDIPNVTCNICREY